jgi:hypothetical protein
MAFARSETATITLRLPAARTIQVTATLLCLVVVGIMSYRTIGYRLDDSLIFAQYARNLADGHGLVFQPGERLNALSSYLYVWLLVPFAFTDLDLGAVGVVLGSVLIAFTCAVLVFLTFPTPGRAGAVAGGASAVLYATSALLWISTAMEVPLALLGATCAIAAANHRRWVLCGIACAVATAARPEFGLVPVVLVIQLVPRDRMAAAWVAAIPAVVMVGFLSFTTAYYGNPLPHSLDVKQAHADVSPGLVFFTGARHFLDLWYIPFGLVLSLGIASVALMAVFATASRAARQVWMLRTVFAPVFVATGIFLWYVLVNVPIYHWYLGSILWAVAVTVPAVCLAGWLATPPREPTRRALTLVLAATVVGSITLAQAVTLDDVLRGEHTTYREVVRYLDANGGPDCSLRTEEVGYLAYYTDCRTIDSLALTTKGALSAFKRGDYDAWLAATRPKFALVPVPLPPFEVSVARAAMRGEYEEIDRGRFDGFLMFRRVDSPPTDRYPILGRFTDDSAAMAENYFAVRGELRPALFMHIGQAREFAVAAPERPILVGAIGITDGAETSTGASFIVTQGGREIFRAVALPSAGWTSFRVPLTASADGRVEFKLSTEVAPGGTAVFGWSAWADLRLEQGP